MTISITLEGSTPDAIQASASELLSELSDLEPTRETTTTDDSETRDALGIVASVVTIVLAIEHVWNRINRRNLSERVETLKKNLELFDKEATLTFDDGTALDLRRALTDRIVDALSERES